MEYVEEFEDDAISGIGFMDNGLKVGTWKYFYPTGDLKHEIEYLNGIENGIFKLFHENGNLAYTGLQFQGKHIGIWTEYYKNGQIQEELEFIDDDKFRPINFWDEQQNQILVNGTGKRIEIYGSYGGPNDVYEQYYEDGIFLREVKIKSWAFLGFKPK